MMYRAGWGALLAVVCVTAGWAQEMPLWRLVNGGEAAPVPAYGGGQSPFLLSAPTKAVPQQGGGDDADSAEAAKEQQRQALVQQARMLSQPQRALQAQMISEAKAMTNGAKGLRVLVNGAWVGVGDDMPIRYVVTAATRDALRALQEVDAQEARALALKVEKTQQDYARQSSHVKAIDPVKRQIIVQGAVGEIILPMNVAP